MRIRLSPLVFSLVVLAHSAFAANDVQQEYYGPYKFVAGSNNIIFSDTAIIRDIVKGQPVDTLYAFNTVTIAGTDTTLTTIGRKTAPWYLIRYQKNGVEKRGAVWGGTLAIHSMTKNGVQFGCGVLSYLIPGVSLKDEAGPELSNVVTFSIKAKSGGIVQECRYNISHESVYFSEQADDSGNVRDTHVLPRKSLPAGTQFYVRYSMSGEACAIPAYSIIAAWDGVRLTRMPLLESNADAGVYHSEESFVFPENKGGMAGQLRIKTVSITEPENPKMAAQKSVNWRSYKWDEAGRAFR